MIKVNTEILRQLNPCADRWQNWLEHYKNFDGSLVEFLELENITARDKIWAAVRLLPRFQVEVFAIDCAFAAYAAYAVAAYAAYAAAAYAAAYAAAAYAAAYAADAYAAAAYAADATERERQVDVLIYLASDL